MEREREKKRSAGGRLTSTSTQDPRPKRHTASRAHEATQTKNGAALSHLEDHGPRALPLDRPRLRPRSRGDEPPDEGRARGLRALPKGGGGLRRKAAGGGLARRLRHGAERLQRSPPRSEPELRRVQPLRHLPVLLER